MHKALACLLLALATGCGQDVAPLPPAAGQAVRASMTWEAGTHLLPDPERDGAILIETDGVVLDLGGARILGTPRAGQPDTPPPDSFAGIGIRVRRARNVVIRNGSIAGYRLGIQAQEAPGLVIENVDASHNWCARLQSTPTESHIGDWMWPHWNDKGEWEAKYGGALSLNDCEDATVRNCRVQFGQNGLLLTRCVNCQVYDNDFRFNSGWGVALFRTTDCDIAYNRMDFCVRGFKHNVYHTGNDSAGIVVFEQSKRNRIVRNSATHCGNGIFLYAGHDTTERTGKGGSNNVLVIENDFRFAVANGIEATFLDGNVYVRNDCSGSEHGIWGGYSRNSVFLENVLHDCRRAGMSIEHGNGNFILRNDFRGSPVGLHLWWDPDPQFVDGVFGQHNDTSSSRNRIEENVFAECRVAVRADGDTDSLWIGNRWGATEAVVDLTDTSRLAMFEGNRFAGADQAPGPELMRIGSRKTLALSETNDRVGTFRPGNVTFDAPAKEAVNPPSMPVFEVSDVPGTQDTRLPPGYPAGRQFIDVGPWGPRDPQDRDRGQPHLPLVFPVALDRGDPRGRFYVTGKGTFDVVIEGDVKPATAKGDAPTIVDIEAGPTPGLHPFKLRLVFADREVVATGTLLRADWDVRFFEMDFNPIQDASKWQSLLGSEPKHRERRDGLVYEWYGKGPPGMSVDRFATLATTRLPLPAGRYELKTMSDDGVRVWVDGKNVLENWTHHAPTEDKTELTLTEGPHDIRVEHFDLGGWAYLSLTLRRLAESAAQ